MTKTGTPNIKYKSHARSPAIGQPHIVPAFWLEMARYSWCSIPFLALSFQLFLAIFEPIRGHTLVPRHVSYDVL